MGRVVAALGAGAFGQAVTVGIQLLSLPAFLAVWSPQEYGVWLMLSALSAYLAMADVGLVTAVGNQMTMDTGRGQVEQANRLFQSAFAFMATVCAGLAVLALLLVALVPVQGLDVGDRRLALAALALGTVLTLFGGLADALFRATGRYAQGILLGNLVRLAEWLGWMAGLAFVGTLAAVAVGGLLVRLVGTLVLVAASARGNHGIVWSAAQARLAQMRGLVVPALSFMAFPLANALNFQGMTLLVGHLFGPAALALFNTYRTLARVAMQLTAVFSHSVWPELSRLYGQGGAAAVRRLYGRSAVLCAALALVTSGLLYLAAPWLLQAWTHGAIPLQAGLMALMLLYAAVAGLSHVPKVVLLATNQHAGLARWVVGLSLLSLALAATLGDRWGLAGTGAAILAAELALAWLSFALARRALCQRPASAAS